MKEIKAMPAFRRVEARHAGPQALGILVPPGVRTQVIVRPRALGYDLLPAQWARDPKVSPKFCLFDRDEAAQVARRLLQALEDAVARAVNPVETIGAPGGGSFQVWMRAAELFWIPCRRIAEMEYQPLLFATYAEARAAGEELATIVWPRADADREYYVNTQKFAG
jgi:hypothetical protein